MKLKEKSVEQRLQSWGLGIRRLLATEFKRGESENTTKMRYCCNSNRNTFVRLSTWHSDHFWLYGCRLQSNQNTCKIYLQSLVMIVWLWFIVMMKRMHYFPFFFLHFSSQISTRGLGISKFKNQCPSKSLISQDVTP